MTDAAARSPVLPGHWAGRRLLNAGFRISSTVRRRSIERAHPVRTQELQLRRLVKRRGKPGLAAIMDSTGSTRFPRFSERYRFERMRHSGTSICERATPFSTPSPGRVGFRTSRCRAGRLRGRPSTFPFRGIWLRSNRRAASGSLAWHVTSRPGSKLFEGRICVLGGSTELETVAPGVRQGDLSGIAAVEVPRILRPYAFPPLALALESDWDRKISRLSEAACEERITLVSGVPSWLLEFFQQILDRTGKSTIAEVWPQLELVVHGGVKFDPYREAFRALIGFDRRRVSRGLSQLRRVHRLRRSGDGVAPAGFRPRHLLRVHSGIRARSTSPQAVLARDCRAGRELRDRCLQLRRHVGSPDR